jgi:hypothetical protein
MAFDKQTEGEPLVHVEKRTTKVNIWVAVGVLVFLLLAALALVHIHHNPPTGP